MEFASLQHDLPTTLQSLSEMYQRQAELRMERIPAVLVPLLILLIAAAVEFVLFGLLMPLFSFLRDPGAVIWLNITTRTTWATASRASPRVLKASALAIGWMLGSVVLIGGLGLAIGFGMAPVLGWVSPVALLLVLVVVAVLVTGVRRTWDLAVLNYLEQAVRLNLPLPAMLRAAEASEHGR